MPVLLSPFLLPLIALINVTPDPVAFQLGSIPVYWYGVCYAVGLAATYLVITREARRRGLNARLVDNGIIIVAIAALIGGRLYHVIDQWQRYQDDLLAIVMPPYTGLGVYGGILTGVIAAAVILRLWHQPFWKWADVIAPGIFVMQAIGRWGNFFNQELYGPPTDLPWGITIDCAHRVPQYPCTMYPPDTTGFHPLFLYESVSGILGAITLLWIARRWGPRMRPGDLFLIWLIWYATVRLALESLRTGNWTVLGVPTATIISVLVIVGALVVLAVRHRPGAADGDRWGDPPDPAAETEAGLQADDPADVAVDTAAEPEPADVTAGAPAAEHAPADVTAGAPEDATDDGAIRPGDGA
jgi:phosphatidylglycerol:prolipoprotein diacylglycerol transferase